MNATNKFAILFYLILSLLLSLTNGCAHTTNSVVIGSSNNLPPGMKEIDDSFWWRCKFKIDWPSDKPDWAMDLLLAHTVVSPVLSLHANDIPYWRFHRRAVRDDAGHQFTFLFYSKPDVASSVFMAINENEVLKHTVEANLVTKVIMTDPKKPQHANIDDTSDPSWSPEVQKYWPSFIMGVSSLWLGLIIEDMQNSRQDFDDINRLLDEYRQVELNVTRKWRNEGQHALLHHLSAIFGYQPMLIKKELIF